MKAEALSCWALGLQAAIIKTGLEHKKWRKKDVQCRSHISFSLLESKLFKLSADKISADNNLIYRLLAGTGVNG